MGHNTPRLQENGRRQKSKVCETFDHLYAILEERKGEMSLQITAEQQEKLDYIRSLQKKYTEHLDNMAKVLETGINTMDESEMAIFLQVRTSASVYDQSVCLFIYLCAGTESLPFYLASSLCKVSLYAAQDQSPPQ